MSSLTGVTLKIPIFKTFGLLSECGNMDQRRSGMKGFKIEVYDKDRLTFDDLIFSTDIDMKPLFATADVEQLDFRPTIQCSTDYPKPKSGKLNSTNVNAGFNDKFKVRAVRK